MFSFHKNAVATESPTRITSQYLSNILDIGFEYAVKQTIFFLF